MKYWENGFYLEQNETNSRYVITDEYWQELLNGQSAGKQIITGEDGKPILINRVVTEESILLTLRKRRSKECFSVINRGALWYKHLTPEQEQELDIWYQNWLDVTETRVIPDEPEWLKE